MKLHHLGVFGVMILGASCGPSGPSAIQNVVTDGDRILIDYDPTQRTNPQMRRVAQQECSKRNKVLKDVTVAPTSSATTSKATVFCE